jgi:hypothetical protein
MTIAAHLGFAAGAAADSPSVRSNLLAFLDGRLPPEELEVTYSDLHGLYGGFKMTLRGTGEVTQKAVRQAVPRPNRLNREQVRAIVKLLLRTEAWLQKTPEATALPDESRATLKITVGGAQSSIWERVREMESNDRLVVIRKRLQKLAWAATGSD